MTKPINYTHPWNFFPTLPEKRTGKGRSILKTLFANPSLPRFGWFYKARKPAGFATWKSDEARRTFSVLTQPSKRFDTTTTRTLFSSLEGKEALPIKTIHSLYERGECSFTDAEQRLKAELPGIIQSLNLVEGEEALITIPVTTPKAAYSHLERRWKIGVWVWRILTLILVLPWLIYLVKQIIPKFRAVKSDADWLWTPGASHISLITISLKKREGTLHVNQYEYFDSKGLPVKHPENMLAQATTTDPKYVADLFPIIDTALRDAGVITPPEITLSHAEYQFQTDTHNCGFWIYQYALNRSKGHNPAETLSNLHALTTTIDFQRQLCASSLNDFLSTYTSPSTVTPEQIRAAGEVEEL